MIIKSFKIFESRATELSESEFKNILKSECKEYIDNPILLQRSKQYKSSKFGFIDPTKFYRNPLEGSTGSKHHQLLMENLPSWSKFPKRSKSIIGITNQSYTIGYGLHRYLVIPFDGVEFGVAPAEDLWSATCVLTDGAPLIGDYSISFDNTFSGMMRSRDISDDSYKYMILDLQRLSDEYKGSLENEYKGYEYSLFKFIKSINKSYNDIEKGLDHYLNPSRFHSWKEKGFKLMDYKELSSINKSDNFEFWTESPCLLYYIGEVEFKVNSNLIKNSWRDFLDKFI